MKLKAPICGETKQTRIYRKGRKCQTKKHAKTSTSKKRRK